MASPYGVLSVGVLQPPPPAQRCGLGGVGEDGAMKFPACCLLSLASTGMRIPLAFCVAIPAFVFPASAQMVPVVPSDLSHWDMFGFSVSVDSGYLLVGSRNDNDKGMDAGSAYLFEVPTNSSTADYELVKFTANNGKAGDHFGESVALQDGIALIGAGAKDALGTNAGCAYLFDADPSSQTFGMQLAWLLPTGNDYDWIGCSVALDSGLALVGAKGADVGAFTAGAAFLFDADPSSPTFGQEMVKLTASDGGNLDGLGCSVSIAGGLALLGAEFAATPGGSSGAAYLFDIDPASPAFGTQLNKFVARNGGSADRFGYGVSLSDGRALVGAPFHERPVFLGSKNEGAAYLFDANPGSASFGALLAELLPAPTYPHHKGLGCSVSLDGRFAALGSPWEAVPRPGKGKTREAGTTYVFDADTSSPNFSKPHSKLQNSFPGYRDYFGDSLCIQNGVLAVGAPEDDTWKQDGGSVFVTRIVDLR